MDPFQGYFDLFSVVIGLFVTSIVYCVYSYKKTYSFWSKRGVNGPTPLPFFGNSLTYIFSCIPDTDIAYRKRYGKMYGIYDGSIPILLISDPDIIERIFITDHNSFKYHTNYVPDDPMLGNQIIFKRGDALKRIRAVFTGGMTISKLKGYFGMIHAENLIGFIDANSVQNSSLKNGNEINVSNMMTLHLLNVVTQIFYGIDLDLFNNSNHELIGLARNFFTFVNALPAFIANHLPYLLIFYGNPSDATNEYVAKLVRHALAERIKLMKQNGGKKTNDFLQQLINADMTEQERVSNSILMIGAAFDTTTVTTSFLLYELARNQAVLRRLQQEVDRVFSKKENGGELNFEDLSSLNFLENCFNENLRMHPTDVRQFRMSTKETKIPTTDVTVPESTSIQTTNFPLHLDPEHFDNPFDFDPDRWNDERKKSIKNCSFMAFGAGPRKCPGGQFALMNAKLAMAAIVLKYDLEVSKRTQIKMPMGRMLLDPTRIWIRFTPRDRS